MFVKFIDITEYKLDPNASVSIPNAEHTYLSTVLHFERKDVEAFIKKEIKDIIICDSDEKAGIPDILRVTTAMLTTANR